MPSSCSSIPAKAMPSAAATRVLVLHAASDWLRASFPAVFGAGEHRPSRSAREPITPRIRRLADTLAVEVLNDRFVSRRAPRLHAAGAAALDRRDLPRAPARLRRPRGAARASRTAASGAPSRCCARGRTRNSTWTSSRARSACRARASTICSSSAPASRRAPTSTCCASRPRSRACPPGQGKIAEVSAELGFSAQSPRRCGWAASGRRRRRRPGRCSSIARDERRTVADRPPRPRGRPRRAAAGAPPAAAGSRPRRPPSCGLPAGSWRPARSGRPRARSPRACRRRPAAAGASPARPLALGGVRAADAVVLDPDLDPAVAPPDADRRRVGAAVLRDVGERLGDHEVDRGLDVRRQRGRARRCAASTGHLARAQSARRAPRRGRGRPAAAGRCRARASAARRRSRGPGAAPRRWSRRRARGPPPAGGGRGRGPCVSRTSRCCGPSWMSRSSRRSDAASAIAGRVAAALDPAYLLLELGAAAQQHRAPGCRAAAAANRTTSGRVSSATAPITRLSHDLGVPALAEAEQLGQALVLVGVGRGSSAARTSRSGRRPPPPTRPA